MVIAVLIVLGLCFGSFVNALVWRLYQQSLPRNKRAASDSELSVSKGRSMCPHCRHTLAWYDLLPVISWLSLGGKCRYCRRSISWQYPLVELLTAALFVVSYLFWPYELASRSSQLLLSIWLVALICFMALIIYDLKWMLLPNRIVFPLIVLGMANVAVLLVNAHSITSTILNVLGGVAVAGGLFFVLFQVSDGKWIGGGDVKLGLAIGLLLGSPALAFLMLFLASIIGLVASLPAVLARKKELSGQIPFGPFLIIAAIIVMLFGRSVIDWYTHTLVLG